MKHGFKQTLCALVALISLLGAGVPAAKGEAAPLKLVATVFPAYDFARALTGGEAELTLLLPPGGDAHSYEPTPQDIIAIQEADLFLYIGGESDAWVEKVLASMGEHAPQAFAMKDCVAGLSEELTGSMEAEASHEADGEAEMDEHVWTSPKNAMLIAAALADTLSRLAPQQAQAIAANNAAYQAQLAELDKAFAEVVAGGKRKVMVFGDRFPFRYFAAAYGLSYDAAFPGCSEDSEPSAKTVISLVDFIRREQIPVIFYIEFSSRKTADILSEETGAHELLFHSCHTVSQQEMDEGATYLSLMGRNVEALREALN